MVRARSGVPHARKRRRIFRKTRGFWGARSKLYRSAKNALMRAERYATIHRKTRKREFRALWIQRINAAARREGISYSVLIHGLARAGVTVDRKMLAELAVNQPAAFSAVVVRAKAALG